MPKQNFIKHAKYKGLHLIPANNIQVEDSTLNSPDYFRIEDFPQTLTAGKNAFLLAGNVASLESLSEIQVECVSGDGNPVYIEIPDYLDANGMRMVTIWVYPWTPSGFGMVTLLATTQQGEIVRWRRLINIDPARPNNTRITFGKKPRVFITEVEKEWLTQTYITGTSLTASSAGQISNAYVNGTSYAYGNGAEFTSDMVGGSLTVASPNYTLPAGTTIQTLTPTGEDNLNQQFFAIVTAVPDSTTLILDRPLMLNYVEVCQVTCFTPESTVLMADGTAKRIDEIIIGDEVKSEKESSKVIAIDKHDDGEYDIYAINNKHAFTTSEHPFKTTNGWKAIDPTKSFEMHGVESSALKVGDTLITAEGHEKIESLKKIGSAPAVYNLRLDNEHVYYVNRYLVHNAKNTTYSNCQISPSYVINQMNDSNYVLEWTQDATYATGSNNIESYAHITLANIDPIAGDVARVKTYMRSHGFVNWNLVGDDNLDFNELLIDGGSFELTKQMGTFKGSGIVSSYWSASAFGYPIQSANHAPALTRESSSLMDSMRISGSEQLADAPIRSNAKIKVENTKPISFYKDNQYQISFKINRSTDAIDLFPPEMVVYMSGSSFDYTDSAEFGKRVAILGFENSVFSWASTVAQVQAGNNQIPAYMPAPNLAGEGSPPFPGSTSQFTNAYMMNQLHQAGTGLTPNIDKLTYTITADRDGTGVPVFEVKAGIWDISEISIQSVNLFGFTPNHTYLLTHVPNPQQDDILDFKFEFYSEDGTKSNVTLLSESIDFSGSNIYIQNAQLVGPMFMGQNLESSGFEFNTMASAMIRTVGPTYPGFDNAKGDGGGGILLWSGSLSSTGKPYAGKGDYYGVGMELVGSESWLRFKTDVTGDGTRNLLDITTKDFFLGSSANYISGSDGNIEISSSNFWLQNDGDVIMQGRITAEAGGTIGGAEIGSSSLAYPPYWEISASAETSDPVSFISSSHFKVSAGGQITASRGDISGWKLHDYILNSIDTNGGIKLDSYNKEITVRTGSGLDTTILSFGRIGGTVADPLFGIEGLDTSGNLLFKLGEDGNKIANWQISGSRLSRVNASGKGIILDADPSTQTIEVREDDNNRVRMYHTTNNDWGIIGTEGGNNIFLLGDPGGNGNRIAAWKFDDKRLYSFTTGVQDKYGISIDADYQLITIHGNAGDGKNNIGDNDRDNVMLAIGQTNTANEWGIKGWNVAGNRIFELSTERQEIAGWAFDDEKFESDNITISSSGDISTKDFQSSQFGTGKGYKIGADGIAEFEEARIRGTLTTAVFEKETVSAVGGALIVANATAMKSGSEVLKAAATAGSSVQAFPVDSVAGFAAGEYILAKATSSIGFMEEILKVNAVDAPNSELDLIRGMNGHMIPTMSSGQVLVSQGANGSGYILLNATSGSETPFIDIVERTGTGVDDLDIKVRLGDLSGINDTAMPSVGGFGLYTDNVFLKGTISSSQGNIGGIDIGQSRLQYKDLWKISSSAATADPAGFISSSKFKVTATGNITASNALLEGGTIGGWTIGSEKLEATNIVLNTNASGNPAIYLNGKNSFGANVDGVWISTDGISVGDADEFNVTHQGSVTASNALFTGKVVADTFSEKMVIVTAANSSSYFANYNNTDGVQLLFDGSGGGERIKTMQLNCIPWNTNANQAKPIQHIKTALGYSGVATEVRVISNHSDIYFDESSMNKGFAGGGGAT